MADYLQYSPLCTNHLTLPCTEIEILIRNNKLISRDIDIVRAMLEGKYPHIFFYNPMTVEIPGECIKHMYGSFMQYDNLELFGAGEVRGGFHMKDYCGVQGFVEYMIHLYIKAILKDMGNASLIKMVIVNTVDSLLSIDLRLRLDGKLQIPAIKMMESAGGNGNDSIHVYDFSSGKKKRYINT